MSGASTGRRAPLLGLATLLVQDPTPWWAWVLVLTSTAGAILHLLALRRARRTYWLVTIGAAGVRWNDTGFEMRWSEVAEVPVLVVRRWRRFFHNSTESYSPRPPKPRSPAVLDLDPSGAPSCSAASQQHPSRSWTASHFPPTSPSVDPSPGIHANSGLRITRHRPAVTRCPHTGGIACCSGRSC